MGQMTADQYLDQIQNQLMKTLTEKKDAMPPGFNQQRFALNCITVIRDMMKDYKKREQLQTVDINSIVLCMIKGAYLGLSSSWRGVRELISSTINSRTTSAILTTS